MMTLPTDERLRRIFIQVYSTLNKAVNLQQPADEPILHHRGSHGGAVLQIDGPNDGLDGAVENDRQAGGVQV